ncbi:hypothetical protein CesoFtcFv8_005618 [Champsocephalus esox]|uniref:Uncharacterized protein n=1 Tax=Champsocephalus esox TaxID=159716 RepID=A0AAN8HA88_9TELE|nr:hypothetical protein CesoFtcFv8_005618 [Champsocephalus esox]
MAAPLEVIVSSDSGSQMWNSTVFDLLSGSSLLSYRGGSSSARGLTLLSGGVPALRAAGQELHQRVGDPEEGPAAAEDRVSRGDHLSDRLP